MDMKRKRNCPSFATFQVLKPKLDVLKPKLDFESPKSQTSRFETERFHVLGVLGGGAPQPQWLVILLTPRGYCRDFNIAVESGLVGGPQRSLDFFYPVHSSFPSFLSPSIRLYYFYRVFFCVCASLISGRAFGTRFALSRRKF